MTELEIKNNNYEVELDENNIIVKEISTNTYKIINLNDLFNKEFYLPESTSSDTVLDINCGIKIKDAIINACKTCK